MGDKWFDTSNSSYHYGWPPLRMSAMGRKRTFRYASSLSRFSRSMLGVYAIARHEELIGPVELPDRF